MPNQHFDVQIISRGGGQRGGRNAVASSAYRSGTVVSALAAATMMLGSSAVASASYRSGEVLYDMRAEKTFDYTAKEDVLHTEIMVPEHAPVWASERQMLWNQVEAAEKRKDAQLARDIIAALPRELNREQQIALVREFVQTQFVDKGMVADIAIHDKYASDGGRQPHCHIMLTLRDIGRDGFGKKNREWNDRTLVSNWRHNFAEITNRHLEAAGRHERLDLRSYAEQGIDKVPGEHMGAQAWNMEQKGQETAKGDKNREITHANEVEELVKRYDVRDAPKVTDSMLDSVHEEDRRIDAPLLASVLGEDHAAEGDWDNGRSEDRPSHEHASWSSQQDETGSKNMSISGSHSDANMIGGDYTDEQLEAMHWASVRQAVRGMVRQSVHAIAEHFERVRRYGQQAMGMSQELLRTVIDRITREQQRADATPQNKDVALTDKVRREAERRRREDLER